VQNQNTPNFSFRYNTKNEVEKYVGIESYSTSDFKGIGGVYKNDFKDFIVNHLFPMILLINILLLI
jgi:hypothetical protein